MDPSLLLYDVVGILFPCEFRSLCWMVTIGEVPWDGDSTLDDVIPKGGLGVWTKGGVPVEGCEDRMDCGPWPDGPAWPKIITPKK